MRVDLWKSSLYIIYGKWLFLQKRILFMKRVKLSGFYYCALQSVCRILKLSKKVGMSCPLPFHSKISFL